MKDDAQHYADLRPPNIGEQIFAASRTDVGLRRMLEALARCNERGA